MRVPRADFFIIIGLLALTSIVIRFFDEGPIEPICVAGGLITALIFIPLGIHYYKRDHPKGFF